MKGRRELVIALLYSIIKVLQFVLLISGPLGNFSDIGAANSICLGLNFVAIMINCVNWKLNHGFMYGDMIFIMVAIIYMFIMMFSNFEQSMNRESGYLKGSRIKAFIEKEYIVMVAALVAIMQMAVFPLIGMIGNPKEFFGRIRINNERNNENNNAIMNIKNDIGISNEKKIEIMIETNDDIRLNEQLNELPPSYEEAVALNSKGEEIYTPLQIIIGTSSNQNPSLI